jgi:nucleotide-binding universal stress UspA family protein
MTHVRRILYATDFSPASRKAFRTAIQMATSSDAVLTIAHVVVPFVPLVPEQYADPAMWDQLNDQATKWGRRQLEGLAKKAATAGVRTQTLLLNGDPAQQIVRAAKAKRMDLIVAGTHGRKGFSKFFLGSVAERVLTSAPCPVVTVKSA